MPSKKSLKQYYFKHSLRLLIRYQQIYIYPLIVVFLILMPKIVSINEKYFVFLFSFNLMIVLWLNSPFYIHQFSYSSEDTKSLIPFPNEFKDLVIIRNLISFIILLIPLLLNLILFTIFYSVTDKVFYGLIFLSVLSLLPAVSIGNLLTGPSIGWNTGFSMSWKSILVILSAFFNDLVIKISSLIFSNLVFGIILVLLFLIYLYFYILSFRKIVRDIALHIGSIAEE